MSSDPHGAAAHDEYEDVTLDPSTRRKLLLGTIICAILVFAVAIFVVAASEDPGHVVERVQDQRDAVINVLTTFFA